MPRRSFASIWQCSTGHVFGNPHSASPCSTATTELVEDTRRAILDYFNAPPDEYTAVFTPNATGALKLAGEAYPFAPGARCLFTFDNHNSVNGIREFARSKGVEVEYAPLTVPDLRIERRQLSRLLDAADPNRANLFAFPAQSNFSGVKHPLEIIDEAHDRGWDVLLDAAAFVPTNRLDLTAVQPGLRDDLLLQDVRIPDRRRLSHRAQQLSPEAHAAMVCRRHGQLRDRAGTDAHSREARGRLRGRDAQLPRASRPSDIGLRYLDRVGIDALQARVSALTAWMLSELLDLRHGNGRPLVRIYGPTTMVMRGGTITLNFYDPDGHLLDYRRVEELAIARRISFRTGCFCNPGAGETAEGLTAEDMLAGLEAGGEMTLPRFLQVIQHRGGKSAGAIRVSLGLASNFDDVETFLAFAAELRDQTHLTIGAVTFDIESCRVIRDGS